MWILQLVGICVFLGVVVTMLEASHNFHRWAVEHSDRVAQRQITKITKITTPIVDIDPDGNIIRITDASGRVVFEEFGA